MKNVVYYKLWVEYELGQADLIFKSPEDAIAWLKWIIDGQGITFEELEDDGLFGVETLTLWKPTK